MIYNLTREQASEKLNISTRTLDRRIRKWKLSHVKKSNKVMLAEKEIDKLWENRDINNVVLDSESNASSNKPQNKDNINYVNQEISNQLSQSIGSFVNVLNEKDKKIEEKNNVILWLQQQVVQMESKLKNTVALPLYEEEKKENLLEKENLKFEKKLLEDRVKKEKIFNIFMFLLIVFIMIVLIIIAKI